MMATLIVIAVNFIWSGQSVKACTRAVYIGPDNMVITGRTMDWKEAISQIKDKKYALKFQGKLEEQPKYTGRILAVGIGYDKQTKEHSCKVEVLE